MEVPRRSITGWKLDRDQRDDLLARCPPIFRDVVADHVTLRSGTDEATSLPTETRGEIVGEIDDGEGVQALIVRIAGTTTRSDGGTYHITWSLDLARGRFARESNDVIARLGWRSLPQSIKVTLHPARF